MKTIVSSLWRSIQARNWTAVRELLDDDLILTFPQSGEKFDLTGFLKINQEYPGDWKIEVLSVNEVKNCVISEIRVIINGEVEWGISFFEFKDKKIHRIKEYWAETFPVPDWRYGMSLSVNQKEK